MLNHSRIKNNYYSAYPSKKGNYKAKIYAYKLVGNKPKMRFTLTILVLILCFSSCKKKAERKTEPKKEKTELKAESNKPKVKPIEKVYLSKVPDSLELITDKNLKGDFNGDNKTDFTSIVRNKINQKIGVLILHNSENSESYVFGAGKEVSEMTDLDWIEVFEMLPKGEIVSPTLVDEETGDIIGQDESKNFKLIGNGIYMSVEESHGGGIIFWNGKEYQWYHIE